jgi:acetoin utilization deacetylase AcuC-like enzyme
MTEQTQITIVTDASLLAHDTGGGEHPEIPERLEVISEQLHLSRYAGSISTVCPQPATREQLTVFHTEAWLFRFEEAVLSGKTYIDHPDNQIGYESFGVAMLSAGTTVTGINLLEEQAAVTVFCLTRPPGHHAEPNMPFGFCFFNNCVIAARYWQTRGRQRVCIFDFDAHHGNGIQTAFEEDSDILYVSIHEHPSFSYPGTGWAEERGLGDAIGTTLNLPVNPGTGDRQILELLENEVEQAVGTFRPEAIIIAAGFDAHVADDMSGLCYSTGLYRELGKKIQQWELRYCPGRLLSVLEGGYELTALAESVEAYLDGLCS